MSGDKDRILASIKFSLRTAYLPDSGVLASRTATEETSDRDLMIDSFRRELEPLGGKSYVSRTAGEAIDTVLAIVREAGADQVLAWAEDQVPLPGLYSALSGAGVAIADPFIPVEVEDRKKKLTVLERIRVGITGAAAGLADTGSVALLSGPGRPRLASLLPPVHIALLPVGLVYPSMAAFFRAFPSVVREASNLVFVTGPSRTADIELTLTRGVHGPGDVHVVLFDY